MEYNSQKEVLVIPEYGRNIQELVRHTKTIEDRDKRQAYIERIVNLMQQMHPQSRNIADSKLKLWEHALRIAGYDLDVDVPEGLAKEEVNKRPDVVPYPEELRKFRHYGKNIRNMIEKCVGMEEGPVRDGFAKVIASYMKLSYKNWHKDLNISDELVKGDLASLSEGKIVLPEDYQIILRVSTSNNSYRKNNNQNRSNNNRRNNNYRSNRGGGGRGGRNPRRR